MFEVSLTRGISSSWNISGTLNLRQNWYKKLSYLMYFITRHFFEIFNNTSASQSRDSGSKAGCFTFNIATIFVQMYTLSREFRHKLEISCHSITDFMKIFFCYFIFVERKAKKRRYVKTQIDNFFSF
jgi:hypothetical protein